MGGSHAGDNQIKWSFRLDYSVVVQGDQQRCDFSSEIEDNKGGTTGVERANSFALTILVPSEGRGEIFLWLGFFHEVVSEGARHDRTHPGWYKIQAFLSDLRGLYIQRQDDDLSTLIVLPRLFLHGEHNYYGPVCKFFCNQQ